MNYSEEDYIQYRFNRAQETLEDARILAENERWNSTINRLYYASFYSVIALLYKNRIKTHTHSGAKNAFNKHFINTGKIPKDFGKIYNQLFTWRQKADYDDIFDFDKERVLPYFDLVEDFIHRIKRLLAED